MDIVKILPYFLAGLYLSYFILFVIILIHERSNPYEKNKREHKLWLKKEKKKEKNKEKRKNKIIKESLKIVEEMRK